MATVERRIMAAARFAGRAHANQRRKGAAQEPYINHLLEVAELLAEAQDVPDPDLVVAGLLHDTIEDTSIAFEELAARFGERVAGLVRECSDDMTIPKAERRRARLEHAARRSDGAKMVKIADLVSNLAAIAASPPAGWSTDKRLGYLETARALQARLRGVNGFLDARFEDVAAEAEGLIRRQEHGETEHPEIGLGFEIDPTAGQPVHMIYLPNTHCRPIGEAERERLADITVRSFPSATILAGEGIYDGARRPVLMLRLRCDSTDALVAFAQRLALAFDERFVGIETGGRYLRIYADDTG